MPRWKRGIDSLCLMRRTPQCEARKTEAAASLSSGWKGGVPPRTDAGSRAACRQQAACRQVTHRQGSGRMTGYPDIEAQFHGVDRMVEPPTAGSERFGSRRLVHPDGAMEFYGVDAGKAPNRRSRITRSADGTNWKTCGLVQQRPCQRAARPVTDEGAFDSLVAQDLRRIEVCRADGRA
jgi:hypothetical protein